jgi:hypothetical protein
VQGLGLDRWRRRDDVLRPLQLPDHDAGAARFPLAVFIAWVIHVTFEKPLVRVGHTLARRDKPFHAV